MHFYLVADCKTRGCESVHILKYLGGNPEHEIEIVMPARLWVRCRLVLPELRLPEQTFDKLSGLRHPRQTS
jgi:hypothetical protein